MMDGAGTEQWRVTWFPHHKSGSHSKILATEEAARSLYDEVKSKGMAPMLETRVLPDWDHVENSALSEEMNARLRKS